MTKLSNMMDLINSDLEADAKGEVKAPPAPADSILSSRAQTLAKISQGKVKNTRDEYVDPNRCRPWRMHNRDLESLTEDSCRDLIDSFLVAKKQRFPAIVRPIRDDPDYDYEIIAGVRRWWTVKWLRDNHHPDFDYLVTVSSLSDEEAFIVSDIENRARKDISDWERANDYRRAIDEFFGGKQSAFSEHLKISKGHLSLLLSLLDIPAEIVRAYPSVTQLSVTLHRELKPLLDNPKSRAAMISTAIELSSDPETAKKSARDVTDALVAGARGIRVKTKRDDKPHILDGQGRVLLNYRADKRGLTLFVPAKQTAENAAALEEAFRKLLRDQQKLT